MLLQKKWRKTLQSPPCPDWYAQNTQLRPALTVSTKHSYCLLRPFFNFFATILKKIANHSEHNNLLTRRFSVNTGRNARIHQFRAG